MNESCPTYERVMSCTQRQRKHIKRFGGNGCVRLAPGGSPCAHHPYEPRQAKRKSAERDKDRLKFSFHKEKVGEKERARENKTCCALWGGYD